MKLNIYRNKYFFALLFLWISLVSIAQVSQAERDALIDFYNATNGNQWTNTLAGDQVWQINDPNSDVSTWYGVTVENGKVVEIALPDNNLNGNIAIGLWELKELGAISLQNNNLNGKIPNAIGELTSLATILLANNNLSDEIPKEIGLLSGLTILWLSNNNLVGKIPTELGNLPVLTILALANNELEGAIPAELNNGGDLQYLILNDNKFSGPLPVFDRILNSGTANSTTPVTTLFGEGVLNIKKNNFSFSDFENVFDTYKSAIGSNFIYAPQAKVDLEETLAVAKEGSITLTSSQLISTNNTYQWYKDGVAISGATSKAYTITEAKDSDAGLYTFKATNSIITGLELERNPITIIVGSGNPCNVSAEERQALVDFYIAMDGDNWKNTKEGNKPWLINDPNSQVCDWYGISILHNKYVRKIVLPRNDMKGTIPASIGEFQYLVTLNLNGNTIIEDLPQEMEQLKVLGGLFLGNCGLTGPLPNAITSIPSLTWLTLTKNNLTSITPGIGNLINLGILDLDDNQLSGELPSDLGKLTKLRKLNLHKNKLSGKLPKEMGNMISLQNLGLSNNNFDEELTDVFANMDKLSMIGLHNNDFKGPLPASLATLPSLTWLNITNNHFSGKVPDFTNLTKFQRLYITRNEFIFSDFENEFAAYKNDLISLLYYPQAKVDKEETRFVSVGGTTVLTTDQLISPNNNYQWYKDGIAIQGATSKEYEITNATENDAGVYHFEATNSIVTVLKLERHPITIKVISGNGLDVQRFCDANFEEYPTVADIISPIPGTITWYTAQIGGDIIEAKEVVDNKVYWADNGFDPRASVEVIVNEGAPDGSDYQIFSRQANATIADLIVEGDTIKWHATPDSQDELSMDTVLENNTIYYASQNGNACRLAVYVFVGTLAPAGEGFQSFCASSDPRVSDLILEGAAIKWYTSETGSELYNTDDKIQSGVVYYATQNDGISESTIRKKVTAYVYEVPAPQGDTQQTINTDDVATISDLFVLGSNIQWYSSATGGRLYKPTDAIEDGKIYYASQTLFGCESKERLAVLVTIKPKEEVNLVECIKFRPDPGEKYIISAWVREDGVIANPTETKSFDEVGPLFADLLNHLLDKVMNQDHVSSVYEPNIQERKYDPLVPFLPNKSSDNFTVYNLENIKDNYGLTIGFSFYFDKDKTTKFEYKTPYVRRGGVFMGYRYPLITGGNSAEDYININFTTARYTADANFEVLYDIDVKITTNNSVKNDLFTKIDKVNYEEYLGIDSPLYVNTIITPTDKSTLDIGLKPEVQYFNYTPDPDYQVMSYEQAKLRLSYIDKNGNSVLPGNDELTNFYAAGPVIKGWQRVVSEFTIPDNAVEMTISLENKNTEAVNAYFDDVRIHPFNGNMKSFVYDPVTQRLMAELDENNYATFYEYDKEGGLVRVKKETEEGVYTIQETRSGTVKKTAEQ